jgi:hypothetical protein
MSIITIVALISISAYPKFSNQLMVTSESYKLLAFLKETQSYGISAYTLPGKRMVYGVEVTKGGEVKRIKIENPATSTNEYYVNNVSYDASVDNTYSVKSLYNIVAVCNDINCDPAASQITKGYVIYRRPNPEGRIVTMEGSIISPGIKEEGFPKLVIFIRHKTDPSIAKRVVILATGQMYTKDW